jgi:hypothetical protein
MITTTTYYTGELKLGDLVAIASFSCVELGFYRGRGQGNSFQYYELSSLARWVDYNDAPHNSPWKSPKAAYFNSYSGSRVIKYSPELLTLEYQVIYEKAIEALKRLKIIPE